MQATGAALFPLPPHWKGRPRPVYAALPPPAPGPLSYPGQNFLPAAIPAMTSSRSPLGTNGKSFELCPTKQYVLDAAEEQGHRPALSSAAGLQQLCRQISLAAWINPIRASS